ncbi:hypothetical protein RhiirC2_785446 [Rhizophagus irregularis]|uniref:DUF8211 domain-containing protein n=1 Tax=Rhizophagus irregularis TaxID=588596 RepID=A0A2N1MWD2_9GLOM|nr:hypothetical protein RhiirC2_785446 [Rhizophagus irregularis]
MSLNRRGCIEHQKFINLFHNIKIQPNTHTNGNNTKQFHANHLFNQWQNRHKKYVFSNRLGILYDVSYCNNAPEYYFKYKNCSMYCKRLDNFQVQHQLQKNNRNRKQKRRFERACKSVFNNRHQSPNKPPPANNITDKLHRARQHRFLFLPSQYINKPIQHLKYHKRSPLHTSKDYGFQIPHAAIILLTIDNTIPITEAIDTIAPPSNDIPIPSEEGKTWHPTLGILIEDELFPYVLTDPIYKTKNCHKRGKDPLTPGSRLWLEAMKNHRAYEDKVKCLTRFQHHYQKSINKLFDRRDTLNDKLNKGIKKGKMTKQLHQLELELAQFNIDYNSTLDPVQLYKCYEGETSDDAKELEQRPHKRLTHHHIDSHLNHDNR